MANEAETKKPDADDKAKGGADGASKTGKRAPGAKEVPPLAWKLVGTSNGTPVTLLKSIEREDVEMQLSRLVAEQYYQDLQILPIDAHAELTVAQLKAKKKAIDDALGSIAEKEVPKSAGRQAGSRTAKKKGASSTQGNGEKKKGKSASTKRPSTASSKRATRGGTQEKAKAAGARVKKKAKAKPKPAKKSKSTRAVRKHK